jgi:DNA repair protein RecN (Recombination protein N)
MLRKLTVSNYAIIDQLTIEPDAHLNTVTGETGAGKSIILGALSLILGERADTTVLINKEEKCVVEAYFDVAENETFRAALRDEELDDEEQCIIRREINTSGKSRAFVNDTPVNLNTLSRLTLLLVDLHQQFDHLALEDDHFHLDVIDAVAQNGKLRNAYSNIYEKYKRTAQELTTLKQKKAQWQKEADYKQFLYDELAQGSFKADEIEQADQQLKQLAHAERIINVLQSARLVMEDGEQPLLNELKRISQQLQTIADVMPESATLEKRLNSSLVELKDIAAELNNLEGKVSLDPKLMQQLQERIDTGYKLLKKHGLNNTNELLLLQQKLEEELKQSLDLSDSIERFTIELQEQLRQVEDEASKLSAQRRKVAPVIEKKVNELLTLVGMPNARIKIITEQKTEPSVLGIDDIQFLLDANKSGQFLPVHKAASGGEMSRIMLCIKSLTAKAMRLPTLIFDEVDTGISGEAARQVSILLRELSQYHQVICITHQPQVAAKGSRHFYVYKDEDNKQRITTKIKVLKQDERVLAIARMIGGEKPSNAAMQNAKELVAD